ncbi:exocyst complex component 7-like [Pyrus ussuriensis x Pyrus communis]|uniref:Exocyst complex component 7-like n=1 Tax=Pyrus ussuriensis x Pyrus communis TaxID=2448454 RepID=A0A5N5F6B8_9ROSA|nr:exocyst complex component 7-like [Pyrus ussuriensis x Pyrus communis]
MAQSISDYNIVIDKIHSRTINDLHEIVKQMVAAGFGKDWLHIKCRKEFLEESLSRLR